MAAFFSWTSRSKLILEGLQKAMNRTAVGAARNALRIQDIGQQTAQLSQNIKKVFNETTELKNSIGQITQVTFESVQVASDMAQVSVQGKQITDKYDTNSY